jgi:hypothetical protein
MSKEREAVTRHTAGQRPSKRNKLNRFGADQTHARNDKCQVEEG